MELFKKMSEPGGPPGSEKRRWKRHAVEIPASVSFSHEGQLSTFDAKADNISRGGLRLFVPRHINPGLRVSIDISFPYHASNLKLRGVVRNADGFRYGVELSDVNPYQEWVIERVCRAYELLT